MAVTAPVLHSDQQNLAQLVGESLSLANNSGLLLDADVGGSFTYLTMQTALVTNASTKHASFQGFIDRLKRAFDYGKALGILSDTNVQAATTVADLIAICPTSSAKQGGPMVIE